MPGTLALANSAYTYQKEQKIWESYQDLYNVSLTNISQSDSEHYEKSSAQFLDLIGNQKTSYIAVNVSDMVYLESATLGEYENLVIANKEWLERQGLQLSPGQEDKKLSQIQTTDITGSSATFLLDSFRSQLALLVNSENTVEDVFTYYSYDSTEGLFIPGVNSAYGGEIHRLKRALILVPQQPLQNLSVDGFLIPLLSNGNLFFSGKDSIEEIAWETGFDRYIFSVESFAQLGLETLKEYRDYFRFYLLSLAALIFGILFTSYQSAAVWASIYKKRIFTLRTSGISYSSLVWPEIGRELAVAASVLVGLAAIHALFSPSHAIEIITVTTLSLLALIAALWLSFINRAKANFTQVAQRK